MANRTFEHVGGPTNGAGSAEFVHDELVSKGERTRQAVLTAAIDHFASVGFRGSSIPVIAREVGITPSAVYAYFASKNALFEGAVDADVALMIADALPELLAGRFDGDFPRVFRQLLASVDNHPLARRILRGQETVGAERLTILPAEVRVQRGIEKALRRGQLDGTVRGDIDSKVMAVGLESVVIALLIAILQTDGVVESNQANGAIAVLEAAIRPSR